MKDTPSNTAPRQRMTWSAVTLAGHLTHVFRTHLCVGCSVPSQHWGTTHRTRSRQAISPRTASSDDPLHARSPGSRIHDRCELRIDFVTSALRRATAADHISPCPGRASTDGCPSPPRIAPHAVSEAPASRPAGARGGTQRRLRASRAPFAELCDRALRRRAAMARHVRAGSGVLCATGVCLRPVTSLGFACPPRVGHRHFHRRHREVSDG